MAAVWKPTYDRFGIHIDFAWRTFKWASESTEQAHVHVVIVGFSCQEQEKPRRLLDYGRVKLVKNINPCLINAENIFVENRTTPISPVPHARSGNKPIDGGNYLFTYEEMQA